MSTRSAIIIKVKKEDLGTTKEFDNSKLTLRKWEGDKDAVELCKPVKIKHNYAGIYCHFDGYPDGVGMVLKKSFSDYDKLLNLIVGGDCSYIEDKAAKRYANRDGEKWDYLQPKQGDTAESVINAIDDEYAYVFEDGKWTCTHYGEEVEF